MARLLALLLAISSISSPALSFADEPDRSWLSAHQKPPLTAEETRALIKRLAKYVYENHLKASDSPQKGMIYEYFDVRRKGEFDQFVQGEALDTMHDGAWFATAMVNAYRATNDPFYKEMLAKWQLPFYLKMLNHSDKLFTTKRNDARDGAMPWNREHGLQQGEKGFVPYYWDDGGSVSLERRQDKNPKAIRPSVDYLVDQENPKFLLNGYSQGSSNHLAQDLAVMLELTWLLFKDSQRPADKELTAQIAEAARNLHASRVRHHGNIPMCVVPAALATNDSELLKNANDSLSPRFWKADNHFTRAFLDFRPGQSSSSPGFADDQQYLYYQGLARGKGTIGKPLAFKLIYDSVTEREFWKRYHDDTSAIPGLNRFDLYPLFAKDGKLEALRSERSGPFKRPIPAGSRMGPQMMIVCGWSLQLLKIYPGIWQEGIERNAARQGLFPFATEEEVRADLERELAGGLRTWEAIFDHYGYIPTSLERGEPWDRFSDSGGYAHLISAATQWLYILEGKRDWEQHSLKPQAN